MDQIQSLLVLWSGQLYCAAHGVGPVFGEWSPRYGVEIVEWEWGIRSGRVGVVVFKIPLPHHISTPTPQSPTPPVSNQSPINQVQQSAVPRTAFQLPYSARGVARAVWAQLIRYSLEWGVFVLVSQHGTARSARAAHSRPPTELFCLDFWSGQN